MTIRDILLHLADDNRINARIETALGIARRHDARVTGLFVTPRIHWPAAAEGRVPESVLAQIRAEAEARAKVVRAEFENSAKRNRIACEWRQAEGDAEPVLSYQSRYADLVVVGQSDPEKPTYAGEDLVEDLVFTAGRPVLVVPYVGSYPVVGDRVLIAWKSGRESARAVKDALPILAKAQSVTILTVNADDRAHYPGQDIAAYLARHGVRAEARKTVAGDIDVADVLLSTAADIGADLIVMGAYSRSRLREAVLGGVTRDILERMTAPTLLAH